MTNLELAKTFERIANLMEIKGELVFKTLAYRRVAEALRTMPEDIRLVQSQGRLMEIPGVGKAIAEKIKELLATGKLQFLEKLEQEVPPSLLELLEVPDIGPKRAAMFWKEGEITNLSELEITARSGNLRQLPGMGEKSEARILAGIETVRRRSNRMLLWHAQNLSNPWLQWLRQQPGVVQAETGGSLRRWRATIGDIDLVVAAANPQPVMEAFAHHPGVGRIISQGDYKTSIEAAEGGNIQLWIQPPERFGTLLQFVTGSKDHNVRLRELAQRRGWSLSERGLENSEGIEHLCPNEEDVYRFLGLPWIPPEMREDRGEIRAALEGCLPRLIKMGDLLADLHTHSEWSDGRNTVLEMAEAARQRGLKTLAITDHSVGTAIANGLSIERLRQQRTQINMIQQQLGDSIRILHGAEVEIHADGTLDYPDAVLEDLDIVVASLHMSLSQPREAITKRLLGVIRNPNVDIIAHPTGRLLPNREGADLDWDAILAAAVESGIALEINANPNRLDMDEIYARRAGEMGIPVSIDTDAHSTAQLGQVIYGVSDARRSWLIPEQVVSAWQPERLYAWLKKRNGPADEASD